MRCFWFEIFECLRKVFLLGCPTVFKMGSASQLIVGLLVCFISSMLCATYSPYVDKDDGRLAELSQLSLFFVIVSTIALRMEEGESSAEIIDVLLVVLLAVPAVVAILLHMGVHNCTIVLNAKAKIARCFAHTARRCFYCGEHTTVASAEPEANNLEPSPSVPSTSEPAHEGVSASLFAQPPLNTRASLGASAAMLAPPPDPAPPPTPAADELAQVQTATQETTSADVSSDSAEQHPRPVATPATRRSADERDEMRQFDTRGTREQPPTHRVSGRAQQICEQTDTASQESDVTASRIVGRARGDSLAEDPSALWLPTRLSAVAEDHADVHA
jgi:pyruvate/2-oxoglutarate dehydrogenase complex dihydrolipoamide acyltransferase (E2) component